MDKKKQIEEMRQDLIEIFDEEYQKRMLITPQNTAEKMTAKGYRKQSEAEWELFSLITSTYYGKQYYFRNEDGSVYSRASHSNISIEDAIDEFLNVFRC